MAGDAEGATQLLAVLAPGGIVPQSWNTANITNEDFPGGYRLNVNKPGSWGIATGSGTLQWGHFTPFETIAFKWNKADRKLIDDSASIPDPGTVQELPLLGIPDAVGSAAKSTIDTVGGLISAISDPALWKRIGLVAAGVVMILAAFAFILKKETVS